MKSLQKHVALPKRAHNNYVAMYKHIRAVFLREGADKNVVWSWNTFNATQEAWNRLYPGDDEVSWVGANGGYSHAQ